MTFICFHSLRHAEMPEARAMLLGRMGNHEEALRIYVHRLNDYLGAEAFVSSFLCYLN